MHFKSFLAGLAVLAIVLPLRSDTPKPSVPPADQMIAELNQRIAEVKQIADLVKQLEDKNFAKRQEASERLIRMGPSAIEPLKRFLANKPNLETATRIQTVLRDLKKRQFKTDKVREALAQRITLEKGIDANTPLKDALDFLQMHYKANFLVDSNAFAAIGVQKVEEQPVQLPPMKNVRLATVLRMLLKQIKGDVYTGSYLIRSDGFVEVTTTYHVLQTVLGPSAPADEEEAEEAEGKSKPAKKRMPAKVSVDPDFLVHIEFDKEPLNEALKEIADAEGVNIVIDPRVGDKAKTPITATLNNALLDTAVRVLAEMADLKVVTLTNVLFVTTKERADALQAEQGKRRYLPVNRPAGGPPAM